MSAPQGLFVAATSIATVLFALAAAPPAHAHEDSNHGTIKVHDEETADPPQRNEPHVDCEDFWVEGVRMEDSQGHLVFYSWPPTGNREEAGRENWTAISHDHERGGFGFRAGPFQLDAGHYRVEAYVDLGHPGNDEHFAKAKTFWVEECDAQPPPCPEGLKAVAEANQSVTLTWEPAEGSDGTNIYRALPDQEFEYIATVGPGVDHYEDTAVEAGQTYTYTVTALFGTSESTTCEEVDVTPIPEFPTVLALGLATIGGILAYATVVRPKA